MIPTTTTKTLTQGKHMQVWEPLTDTWANKRAQQTFSVQKDMQGDWFYIDRKGMVHVLRFGEDIKDWTLWNE